MQPYSPLIESHMQAFYKTLSEKDRRRYAAIEAHKLGRGGINYIAGILGCDRHTISLGMHELSDSEALQQTRIHHEGGGRPSSFDVIPGLDAAFLHVLADHTAGSPMKSNIKWTNLTRQEIADRLHEHHIHVSVTVIDQLLEKHGFVRRKAQKRKRTGESQHRDEQFQKIARLQQEYAAAANLVISIDTKKRVDWRSLS